MEKWTKYRACIWNFLLGATVVAVVIVIAWASEVRRICGNKLQTSSVSGSFLIKITHKYMCIDNPKWFGKRCYVLNDV